MTTTTRARVGLLVLAVLTAPSVAAAQAVAARLEIAPAVVRLQAGDSIRLAAVAYDSAGNRLTDVPIRFISSDRANLRVSRAGAVTALRGGAYRVTAVAQDGGNARAAVPVTVAAAPIVRVSVTGKAGRLLVGELVQHRITVVDAAGQERPDAAVAWAASDPRVANVDPTGLVTAVAEGRVTVRATAGGVTGAIEYQVAANPIRTFALTLPADSVRTGDVVHVPAVALDARNRPIDDVTVTYTVVGDPHAAATADVPQAEIDQQGRFVAYAPGTYRVFATGAGHGATGVIRVGPRHVSRRVELVGQGAVRDAHTSDLWVWEGADGRDYAVTGTWGANGAAYFWDVTDPSTPALVDSVVVDARTVNDVKVSEDGRVCVISREGASNRRNGIVIIDCSDPRNVSILSTYDDDLTGGVHNLFIWRQHVYAVNNGRKYDIINIENPRHPHRVGVFELDTPGHGIHDVWIVDGIAYSSNWQDGTVLVDVGNGVGGGSPSDPKEIARFPAVGGRNHAAFPYTSPTGKRYLFMGDEIFPYGLNTQRGSTPNRAAGYIHILDITDLQHPEEVARYEVPEAGSHNFWIQGDTLYAAFYNGGLRVVDVSGELKGNLYHQGREIAQFLPYDPQGYVANAPFTWGPQPFKGHVFFSDWNSGLWAVRLQGPETLTP